MTPLRPKTRLILGSLVSGVVWYGQIWVSGMPSIGSTPWNTTPIIYHARAWYRFLCTHHVFTLPKTPKIEVKRWELKCSNMHKMDPKCAKSPTPPNHGTTTFQHVPSDMGGKCSIYEKKGSHFLSYFVYTLFVCTRCIVKSTISMLPWRQSLLL